MSEAPSDLVARYMNGHSLRKCLGNILASSGDVLREIILTIPVLLFLIIIGDQFGQRKFLIKDLACVSDTCGNHEERDLGMRLRYPRGRRILASPSARSFFSRRHCPWRDHYALALFSAAIAVQTFWWAKCLELSSFFTFFGPCAPFS